jgi:SulP family sulfate permease
MTENQPPPTRRVERDEPHADGAGGVRLARLLPIVSWLPSYDRRWLRGDVAAGIAVTALVVPKNLGYAGIAGVPLENGLYAAAAGAIIYALFCTSRQISTGPSSSLAAVAGGAVLATKLGGQEAAQLVAAITLVTGALFLLLALFRMGWIAQFLSKAVITGFLAGAAVDVTIGELPKLTGTSSSGDSAWRELATWIQGLGEIHWTTLVLGLVSLGVILGLRFAAPAVPGALVLVVGGLVASGLFDLGAHGVALVGHVPRGLPSPALPDWDLVRTHLSTIGIASVALLLIGFSQTAGDARAFATRHRYRIDVNQESVAQGMANVGAGVFQGMPVSTSLSASSLNESTGARTPVASLITGGLVLLTLIVLAPLFSALPKAVLAAVIIDAVIFGMIDVGELRRLHRVARVDFWIAAAAILGVLSAGVLAGVAIGVVLSLGWLIYVATSPRMPVLGRQPGTQAFRELDENPGDETFPGIAVVRVDSGLFFATAEALDDRVRAVIRDSEPRLHTLVIDLEGVDFVDSQGSAKLAELYEVAKTDGVTLRLARVKPQVLAVIDADGMVATLGADSIHGNVDQAIEAQLAEDARLGAETGA